MDGTWYTRVLVLCWTGMHWVGYLVYHDISNIKLKEYEFYYGYAMMCCYILPVHLNLLLSFGDALCLL